MKFKEIFNSIFLKFLGVTLFIGILPIALYPFSKYYQKEYEYYEGNHGPLHQFPSGFYQDEPPQGADWLIDMTFVWPMLVMFLLSLIAILYFLFSKKYLIGLSYLIPALLSFVLAIYQVGNLAWLFD